MSNNGMLNDMEFEGELNRMGGDQLELIKFVARQQHAANNRSVDHEARLKIVENRSKKMLGAIGSAGVFLGGLIVAIMEFAIRR